MAQWHIYAKDGIAVRSNPKRIRRAFAEHSVDSGLIGSVRYKDFDGDDTTFLRPYLIKRAYYQHEQEVRLILPREPMDDEEGLYLQIDGRELIEEIRISPLLPHGEALGLKSALESYVNCERGKRCDDLSFIPTVISDAKDTSGSLMERAEFFQPKRTRISNFGKIKMPFLLGDDIKRGLSDD